jgi:hypothetical protein
MGKPLTIVFCLPGTNFSGKFLECWTEVVAYCLRNRIRLILSCKLSCNICYVRNMCLGADVSRGVRQKPFNGAVDYDFLMWIDSDILFTPAQFQRLLSHDKEIVSGGYAMEGGQNLATVQEWDEEFLKRNSFFKFMKPQEIEGRKDLISIAYRHVVHAGKEGGEYPWFKPLEKKNGNMAYFTMEDVAFCLRAREKGIKVLLIHR